MPQHQRTTTAAVPEVGPSAVGLGMNSNEREKNRESRKKEKIPSSNITPFHSYILPVYIAQQTMGALYGLADLATLGSLLNLSSVEPYVRTSNLVGVPTVGTEVVKLDSLYDFEMIRTFFKSCSPRNDQELLTFETFLETASRDVVLVIVVTSQGQYNSTFAGSKRSIIEINEDDKWTMPTLMRLNNWAAYVSKESGIKTAIFRVRRVFVMDARPMKALPLPEIVDVFGSAVRQQISKSGSVTMLLNEWRAVHSKADNSFYHYIPGFRRICTSVDEVDHSQTVISASQAFSQHLNDSGNEAIIGVHIRGEKLLWKYQAKFVTCFNQLDNLLHNLKSRVSIRQVRLIHDFGKYGTNDCKGMCKKYRSQYLSEIKKHNYQIVYFDLDKFPSFPHHSAFASYVEREYLSRVDVLITIGYGEFHNSIVARFLNRSSRNKDNLYKLCSKNIPANEVVH